MAPSGRDALLRPSLGSNTTNKTFTVVKIEGYSNDNSKKSQSKRSAIINKILQTSDNKRLKTNTSVSNQGLVSITEAKSTTFNNQMHPPDPNNGPRTIKNNTASPTDIVNESPMNHAIKNAAINEELKIRIFVKDVIFHKMKFITAKELDDTGSMSLCAFVCKHFKIPEKSWDSWWLVNKNTVKLEIDAQRNYRSQEIKKAFLGKCIVES